MAVIPEKFYVTRVYRSAEEMLGWMVVADNEETKKFKQSKEKADRWASQNISRQSMEPIYVDNTPRTGFRMVTNVSRYSTSNVVWRIMHPEGFEFEITSDNLCDLLETNTIVEGEFQDELFFTHNKKLVNEKTKLFADLVAREAQKKTQQKNVQEVEVGDVIHVSMAGNYNNTNIEYDFVYCGKYHAINISKNDSSQFTSKSSLKFVVRNLEDNEYYALSKLPDFTISNHIDVDRATVIEEMNTQIRTTNKYVSNYEFYYNYIPNYLDVMFIHDKPYKIEDVHLQYVEQPFSSIESIKNSKIYKVGNHRITAFRLEYVQTYWGGNQVSYSSSDKCDGNTYSNNYNFSLVNLLAYVMRDYNSISERTYQTTQIPIPQTVEVGYYTL
jgi:hypothetical protein